MLEILSLVLGGVLRFIPEVMSLVDKQRAREHEKSMFDLQLRADEQRAKLEVQKLEKQGEIANNALEMQALIEATKAQATAFQKTGNKWLDALLVLAETASSFVRPVLTYWYCVLAYGSYKVASYIMLRSSNVSWENAVTLLWTQNDVSVMMSIVGFWFVDRSIRKQGK
jgi:hypothetical protein